MKPERSLNIIQYLFLLLGAGLLIGAFYAFSSTKHFVIRAVPAQGTVVGLETSYSSSKSGPSKRYHPVIEFMAGPRKIYFTSSAGSSPPSYVVGESVKVLYEESN